MTNNKRWLEAVQNMRERLISDGYCLSKLKAEKVIFNKNTTIFIDDDGEKYTSRPYDEKFDEEKGLLMCIAKANGYTHNDIKRLLHNATRRTERVEETKKNTNLKLKLGDVVALSKDSYYPNIVGKIVGIDPYDNTTPYLVYSKLVYGNGCNGSKTTHKIDHEMDYNCTWVDKNNLKKIN